MSYHYIQQQIAYGSEQSKKRVDLFKSSHNRSCVHAYTIDLRTQSSSYLTDNTKPFAHPPITLFMEGHGRLQFNLSFTSHTTAPYRSGIEYFPFSRFSFDLNICHGQKNTPKIINTIKTLAKIQDTFDLLKFEPPTIIWSGNGYHLYIPAESQIAILEEYAKTYYLQSART
jgi:hypothetical protein